MTMTTMSDSAADDAMLADAAEQLLAGQCLPATVRAIEAGGSPAALWQAIADSGFADALVPEAMGGAGLGLRDVAAVVEACGRHGLPLPLAQTMLARGLLAAAGMQPPAGMIALAVREARAVQAAQTPGVAAALTVHDGSVADWVLLDDGDQLVLLDARQAERRTAGDSTLNAQLRWPGAGRPAFTGSRDNIDLLAQQALLLSLQMAGAMRRVFDMSLQHANDRHQFGRSIGKFQAIQHQLAVMAEHTAAATMAARMACASGALQADPLACAVAKARCSEVVVSITSTAHAVHGAIGITAEFDLQLFTRRLQAWRVMAGSESFWNARIGRALLASDHATLPEFVRCMLCPQH